MGAQGAAECTKPARDACSTAGPCATIPNVEIVNVRITTVTDDNVARRCDGCLEVIAGTPWRINILDIVAAGAGGRLDRHAGDQPGAVPVPPGPGPRPALDGGEGLPVLSQGRGPRDHAADPDPGRRRRLASAGACATGSIATSTSSFPPDPASRPAPSSASGSPDAVDAVDAELSGFYSPPAAAAHGAPRFTQISRPEVSDRRRGSRLRPRRTPPPGPRPCRAPARRRPRHAATLGRRRPGRGVHDARRPPPLRPARDRAPPRGPPSRPAALRSRRWARPPIRCRGRTAGATTRPRPTTTSGPRSRPPTARRSGPTVGASSSSLVAYLDAENDAARVAAEARAAALTEDLGRRLAAAGLSLTESVGLFVTARRPFLAELGAIARRRALTGRSSQRDVRGRVGVARPPPHPARRRPPEGRPDAALAAPHADRDRSRSSSRSRCSTSGASGTARSSSPGRSGCCSTASARRPRRSPRRPAGATRCTAPGTSPGRC